MMLKRNGSKLISMLSAFASNTVILVVATIVLYHFNEEAKIFGLGFSHLYVLLMAIPIITWMNFLILAFIKGRKDNNRN
jgi:hypothetical protein